MAASLSGLVTDTGRAFAVKEPVPIHVQQVINGSKVTDHHALLPTKSMANADLAALPAGERNILRLIAARLLCAVGEPHRYAETTLTTICAGEEFSAKGKVVLSDGWKAMERKMLGELLGKQKEPAVLPDVQEQSRCSVSGAELKEGQTSPPKHFTEDLLLHAMETASADSMPEGVEDFDYMIGHTNIPQKDDLVKACRKAFGKDPLITFKATLKIARKPKYFLGIKIHRAILQISWELTSEYTNTSVVDVITLDPSKTEQEKTGEVNKRISEIAQEYPLCKITTEYAKSAPADDNNTDDTYHLLWSSDRLEIAREVDSRITKIYADLVSLEKMMHYKRNIIDVLMDIAPHINADEGRRLTLVEKCKKRWLRKAADTKHSDDYHGKFNDEDNENEK